MKIAYGISKLINAGPVNVLEQIVKYYPDRDDDIYIYVFSSQNKNDPLVVDRFISYGVNVFYIDSFSDFFNFFRDAKKINILHSHCIRSLFYFNLVKRRKSISASTSHNMPLKDWPLEKGKLKGTLIGWVHKYLLGNTDVVFTISEEMHSYFDCRGYLITNGVDSKRFLSEINIPIEYKYIFCGRFIDRKNVKNVFNYVCKNMDNTDKAIFLGDGPYRNELESIAEKNNLDITFLGNVKNPEYYYNRSKYFISLSLAEGYPLSVLEAAMCGCNLILSNINPHIEIVKYINIYSYKLVKDNSFDNDEKIQSFECEMKRKKANSNIALVNFSSDKMANSYYEIYQKLLIK